LLNRAVNSLFIDHSSEIKLRAAVIIFFTIAIDHEGFGAVTPELALNSSKSNPKCDYAESIKNDLLDIIKAGQVWKGFR
jgi:hypothetical protein